MSKFIRVDSDGNVQQLKPELFSGGGGDFQAYIKKNPTILGENISIIASQVETGQGKRLDILAMEEISEGIARPVIIDIKSSEATTDALLQLLRNANWVLTNTELVNDYAENSKTKFKDIDETNIKAIIVAPGIKEDLIELSAYIIGNISFGFLEFKRFKDDVGDLLVLDWKDSAALSGLTLEKDREWDWKRYESELKINPERIKTAKYIFESLVKLNSERGWGLTPVFRKAYIPFKKSGNNVVQIELWTKPCLVIKLPKKPKDLGLSEVHPDLEQSYDDKYLQYWFRITSSSVDIEEFSEYIEKALQLL